MRSCRESKKLTQIPAAHQPSFAGLSQNPFRAQIPVVEEFACSYYQKIRPEIWKSVEIWGQHF
jgi:hypothetical protein